MQQKVPFINHKKHRNNSVTTNPSIYLNILLNVYFYDYVYILFYYFSKKADLIQLFKHGIFLPLTHTGNITDNTFTMWYPSFYTQAVRQYLSSIVPNRVEILYLIMANVTVTIYYVVLLLAIFSNNILKKITWMHLCFYCYLPSCICMIVSCIEKLLCICYSYFGTGFILKLVKF